LLLGLLLGLLAALVRDATDTRVRSSEAVADRLQIPLLGELARPPGNNDAVLLTDPASPVSEAFRLLRTSVAFMLLGHPAKMLLVTSARPEEGKSTTSFNLAAAAALAGQHVILVDLDLRRPRAHALAGVAPEPGITEVALGELSLEDAMHRLDLPTGLSAGRQNGHKPGSLRVLPSGRVPPAPAEFVGSRAVREILTDVRSRADLVVIDSTPLLGVSDAFSLTPHMDAVLVVVHREFASTRLLDRLQGYLHRVPAHVLGVVVTGVTPRDSYGYRYRYRPASLVSEGGEREAQDEPTSPPARG
jgi:capsular exopolysaccharide synthesis family protein